MVGELTVKVIVANHAHLLVQKIALHSALERVVQIVLDHAAIHVIQLVFMTV